MHNDRRACASPTVRYLGWEVFSLLALRHFRGAYTRVRTARMTSSVAFYKRMQFRGVSLWIAVFSRRKAQLFCVARAFRLYKGTQQWDIIGVI